MKKYFVALVIGHMGHIRIENYDIIEATGPIEASVKYNLKYDCGRVRGICLGEYNEEDGTVAVPINYFQNFSSK